MKYAIALFLVISLSSCGNGKNERTLDKQLAWAGKQCFNYSGNGDRISIRANFTNAVVYGSLEYEWAEKDLNKGTIEGKMIGDTLVANYTFQSEGVTSIRQVVFLFDSESNAREGYGESVMEGDQLRFKDIRKLDFKESPLLVKTDCQ
jgi:hypothetical protein